MLTGNKIFMCSRRTFRNFGHKREPIPVITTLWHGFLTCTFIGLGIEWKRIHRFIFGTDEEKLDAVMKNNEELKES